MKFRKRLFVFIMILAIACDQWTPAFAASADSPQLEAESAIVIDADSGKILYEKDIYTKRQPASTTKIVTCMVVLEHLELDDTLTAKHDAVQMGSIIDIKKGEKFVVEDLLYALMLPSANDAAVAFAEEIGGNETNFCKLMNEWAEDCGAKSTNFLNPSGLNWQGQEEHLTTAYDLALITKEAMKNKTFRKLISTESYTMPATNKSKKRELKNTNKLLWDTEPITVEEETTSTKNGKTVVNTKEIEFVPKYEGTIGVKTGQTSTAGACLVGAVERNGTELISVVLNSGADSRFYDTAKMWDYVLENFYDTHNIVRKNEHVGKVRVKRGEHRHVAGIAESAAAVTVTSGAEIDGVTTEFEEMELQAPVKKGDKVGVIKVYNGNELVSQTDVVAAETIEKGGPLSYIGIPDWLAVLIYIAAALILLMLLIIWLLRRRARKRRRRRKAAAARGSQYQAGQSYQRQQRSGTRPPVRPNQESQQPSSDRRARNAAKRKKRKSKGRVQR